MVIPAHDEAAVVERCLRALLADARPGEFEVVVVANGCADDTALRAKTAETLLPCDVLVLELAVASKSAALRAGDGAVSVYPRLYVDADVVCPTASARALVDALKEPAAELAVPERVLDLTEVTRSARAYLRTWEGFPWVRVQPSGRGVYGLSHTGRRRLGGFPDVVADDYWVTTRFPEDAVRVVSEAPVTIPPAPSVRALVRARTRMFAGNLQLGSVPHPPPECGGRRSYLVRRVGRPAAWPGLALYVGVTMLAKSRARRALRGGRIPWGRAPSEREPA
ncbi:MAG: glycosyltransferase [Actinomycetes bacterium]